MNTFKHIVIVVIWSAVAFFSLLMALTHIPPCQQWLGEKVTVALSQKLGTAVTLERIDLGLLNRLVIDGVQIIDQQRKPMFRVGRMSVKVDYLPLLKGRIVITSAQLFNAHASLYRENAASPLNFQFQCAYITKDFNRGFAVSQREAPCLQGTLWACTKQDVLASYATLRQGAVAGFLPAVAQVEHEH